VSRPLIAVEFEQDVRLVAAQWAFIQWIVTIDRTDYAVKLRLHIDEDCFIQVYRNVQNGLISFTLVLIGPECTGVTVMEAPGIGIPAVRPIPMTSQLKEAAW
jgi:hypothetical protein